MTKLTQLFFVVTLIICTSCGEDTSNKSNAPAATNEYATLINKYEEHIKNNDTSPNEALDYIAKSAIVYYRMGSNSGLFSSFTELLQKYPEETIAPILAESVLDTLLQGITEPTTGRIVPAVATQYIQLTEIYAKSKPNAPESPEKLYKSGEIARSIGNFEQAIALYETVETKFPSYKKASKALFMQAFTYAEDLNKMDKARELYEAFIVKYPTDDFVDDAQMLLQTLGKSDEEIFQQLENQ